MDLRGAAVAVTGATGFLGRYLVDVLLARGARVIGVVRNPGRVPGLAGWAGRVLGLQPLFAFSHGHARPLRPSQGREAALERLVGRCLADRGDGTLHLAAMHACAGEDARALLDRVGAECPPATSFVAEFSPVMVAHTGPGLVGLGWWWERPEDDGYRGVPRERRSRSSSRRHR